MDFKNVNEIYTLQNTSGWDPLYISSYPLYIKDEHLLEASKLIWSF